MRTWQADHAYCLDTARHFREMARDFRHPYDKEAAREALAIARRTRLAQAPDWQRAA